MANKYRIQSRRPFRQNGVSDQFGNELGLLREKLFELGLLVLSVEELVHSRLEGVPEVGGDGRGYCGRSGEKKRDEAVDFHFHPLSIVCRLA